MLRGRALAMRIFFGVKSNMTLQKTNAKQHNSIGKLLAKAPEPFESIVATWNNR